MIPPPTVHIVDDDEATRKATARLLSAAGFTVHTHASGQDLLADLSPDSPGCIVLDVRMPGLSGLDLQVALGEREDALPIIFVTGHAEVPDTVRAIQRGAVDYLTKPIEAPVLVEAVTRALAQDAEARTRRQRQQSLRARYDRLTERERQVLVHLISGQLNKQVAADLSITERTIKLHRARILEKLEVDSMASLARFAVDLGIEPSNPDK
jgi:two-component system, LuxR family, response regulator FixJ